MRPSPQKQQMIHQVSSTHSQHQQNGQKPASLHITYKITPNDEQNYT